MKPHTLPSAYNETTSPMCKKLLDDSFAALFELSSMMVASGRLVVLCAKSSSIEFNQIRENSIFSTFYEKFLFFFLF